SRDGVVVIRASAFDADDVVVPVAVEQLAPRIDAGARGLARHDDADGLPATADAVTLQVERLAGTGAIARREDADLDGVVHRDLGLAADAVRLHLRRHNLERHLVLAGRRRLDLRLARAE